MTSVASTNATTGAATSLLTSSTSGSGSASTTTSSSTDALSGLSSNFNNFLTMLTTQMQNQDPLSPMDSNQMTSQLVQFTQVEQSINTNSKLDSLISLQQGSTGSAAIGYIGKVVQTDGNQLVYQGTPLPLSYNLSGAVQAASIQVLDSNGNVVRTMSAATTAGDHTVTWDGNDDTGTAVASGLYKLNVTTTALSGNTTATTVTTKSAGAVTGVDMSGTTPTLNMGTLTVALDKVSAVY